MKLQPNYYQDRVCLNVLAGSHENAKAIYHAAESHVVVGVLAKNYADLTQAQEDMRQYAKEIDNALSIGLGAGDPTQSPRVAQLAKILQPQHVNQVFTGAATTRALLGQNETVVNALISPTGQVGYVNIATGPLSALFPPVLAPVDSAIALLKDMGASSAKFFNMKGLQHKDEFAYLASACAEQHFFLEPTGGIDLDNFEEILQIALNAGVEKIIPHIYSSIIDPISGNTRPEAVQRLLDIVKRNIT